MLAFDHRGSFKKLMNPQDPGSVTNEQAVALKKEIIDSLRGQFSSILIDQDIGLKAFEPKDTSFLLPVEKSGYEQEGNDRLTELQYSVDSLKENGATGAKLLVFFNPYGKTVQNQLEVAKKVMEECKKKDFPLFLEIRTYNNDTLEADKMNAEERNDHVLTSLKLFLKNGIEPEVYKLEYPGSALGCQTITAILQEHSSEKNIPWILLTMGAGFEEFASQLEEASLRGCSGFLAGRAVWADVCTLHGDEKDKFLKEVLPERFKKICQIMEGN